MTKREKLDILRSQYFEYHKALKKILSGQSYEIEGVRLTRADFYDVHNALARLDREITRLERQISGIKRSRLRVVVPLEGRIKP